MWGRSAVGLRSAAKAAVPPLALKNMDSMFSYSYLFLSYLHFAEDKTV